VSGQGTTECGFAGDNCCTSLEVPGGGPFNSDEGSASLSGFRLDKYLVTVGRFRPFVTAFDAGWVPSPGSGKHTHVNGGLGLQNVGYGRSPVVYETGWLAANDASLAPTDANLSAGDGSWTAVVGANENLPLTNVNWDEAYAFCIWDGGFLPSFAEIRYADVGGAEQLIYPWGTMAPGETNEYSIYNCYYPPGLGCVAANWVENLAPVGTPPLGAGRWGQADLDGEVFEWTMDSVWSSPVTPCVNCTAATSGATVFTVGAWFNGPVAVLDQTGISNLAPAGRAYYQGFRCARTP